MTDKTIKELRSELLQSKIAHLREVEALKKRIAVQRARTERVAWEMPTIELLVQAVREYRAGGTSIRKLVAKYGIERGRLWRAIGQADKALPTVDRPGKHIQQTKREIMEGHREFIARLAELCDEE
jgi:hypothetical protein